MPKYRILSLDGGGIKGIITAIILKRLSGEPGLEDWLSKADLITGTSTGGLIALGLAKGLALDEIIALYRNKGEEIFDDSWIDNVIDLGKISGADYDITNLTKILRNIFGETKLSELSRRVLITTFDLDNNESSDSKRTWKPKLFHNFPGSDSDGEQPAYKVGLYTSAAPPP
ncbi:MAG: patatin-like phospholipase family protein [Chlorobi bacterium]|nr:patatin-like phospholipase family protein [Chlorobiota bacterium]MCI0716250.1 patatin-like phospholipase family protein [Chlorobiota bacterium]